MVTGSGSNCNSGNDGSSNDGGSDDGGYIDGDGNTNGSSGSIDGNSNGGNCNSNGKVVAIVKAMAVAMAATRRQQQWRGAQSTID